VDWREGGAVTEVKNQGAVRWVGLGWMGWLMDGGLAVVGWRGGGVIRKGCNSRRRAWLATGYRISPPPPCNPAVWLVLGVLRHRRG